MKRTLLWVVAITVAVAAAPEYKVTGKIKVGGNGGWDYVYIDSAAQRLYATLGIATVYRNIKSLLAERWLDPVSLPGQATRYEVAGKAHHHHFHCRKCGRMYELGDCAAAVLPKPPRGFRVAGHELLLYGNCARCAETSPAAKRRPRSRR